MALIKVDDKEYLELKVEAQVLQERVSSLKRENEELRSDKAVLSKKIDGLMEALVAKEAPAAYADMRASEAIENMTEEDIEAQQRNKAEAAFYRKYTTELEKPTLFTDADEMMATLSRSFVKPPGAESVHGNDES